MPIEMIEEDGDMKSSARGKKREDNPEYDLDRMPPATFTDFEKIRK
jgi:hypothetical protein